MFLFLSDDFLQQQCVSIQGFIRVYLVLFHQEADGSYRPLRPPPGLSCSSRSRLTTDDDVTDWLCLLLEAGDAQGEVKGQLLL